MSVIICIIIAFLIYLKLSAPTRKRNRINKTTYEYFSKYILNEHIIIDSNIWMNRAYDVFFVTLEKQLLNAGRVIELFGPQFDEICNIKKRTSFGGGQNSSARCAIGRIEDFQLKEILKIRPLSIDAKQGAYADPLIIKILLEHTNNDESAVLVTDDIELRIRTREFISEKRNLCAILSGKELIEMSVDYCDVNGFVYEKADLNDYYEKMKQSNQHETKNTKHGVSVSIGQSNSWPS
jgi:hypothetical protein